MTSLASSSYMRLHDCPFTEYFNFSAAVVQVPKAAVFLFLFLILSLFRFSDRPKRVSCVVRSASLRILKMHACFLVNSPQRVISILTSNNHVIDTGRMLIAIIVVSHTNLHACCGSVLKGEKKVKSYDIKFVKVDIF